MIRRPSVSWLGTTISILVLSVQAIILVTSAGAQESGVAKTESLPDLVNRLSPEQKNQFSEARNAFTAHQYSIALATFKLLLTQLPSDPILSKFTAEAALNCGETSFALKIVKPIANADPDDFQAAALLTRACAESGDTACRDSGVAHMHDLHRRGITPQRMQDYVVERVKLGDSMLVIWASLEPWGQYKVYDYGQVLDNQGKIFLSISIESSDGDQELFAKEHRKEAAEGLRRFSLDAYRETGLNSSGQRTQTHYTYKFFVGQPGYDLVREEFVDVANGKSKPLSSRTNLIVP